MKAPSRTVKAIILMLASIAGFSAMNIVIRMLSQGMPSTQMVLLRNISSLLFVVLWYMALKRRWSVFLTKRLKGHFWRASVGVYRTPRSTGK